jgi:transcriptional regulator with PAS, ATPase and Fis domain
VQLFIAKYRDRYTATIQELPVELLNRFLQYDWPGNVRELENSIKRFLVLSNHHSVFDTVAPSNEQLEDTVPASPAAPMRLLDVAAHAAEEAEKRLVRQVLAETQGNRKLAAERMNISYKALLNKLKRWKTAPSRPAEAGRETAQTGASRSSTLASNEHCLRSPSSGAFCERGHGGE